MCLCLRVCVGVCAHARVSTYTYVTSYPQNHVDDFESNMFWLKFWNKMVKEHPPIAHEDDCHNEVVATLQSSLFFSLVHCGYCSKNEKSSIVHLWHCCYPSSFLCTCSNTGFLVERGMQEETLTLRLLIPRKAGPWILPHFNQVKS